MPIGPGGELTHAQKSFLYDKMQLRDKASYDNGHASKRRRTSQHQLDVRLSSRDLSDLQHVGTRTPATSSRSSYIRKKPGQQFTREPQDLLSSSPFGTRQQTQNRDQRSHTHIPDSFGPDEGLDSSDESPVYISGKDKHKSVDNVKVVIPVSQSPITTHHVPVNEWSTSPFKTPKTDKKTFPGKAPGDDEIEELSKEQFTASSRSVKSPPQTAITSVNKNAGSSMLGVGRRLSDAIVAPFVSGPKEFQNVDRMIKSSIIPNMRNLGIPASTNMKNHMGHFRLNEKSSNDSNSISRSNDGSPPKNPTPSKKSVFSSLPLEEVDDDLNQEEVSERKFSVRGSLKPKVPQKSIDQAVIWRPTAERDELQLDSVEKPLPKPTKGRDESWLNFGSKIESRLSRKPPVSGSKLTKELSSTKNDQKLTLELRGFFVESELKSIQSEAESLALVVNMDANDKPVYKIMEKDKVVYDLWVSKINKLDFSEPSGIIIAEGSRSGSVTYLLGLWFSHGNDAQLCLDLFGKRILVTRRDRNSFIARFKSRQSAIREKASKNEEIELTKARVNRNRGIPVETSLPQSSNKVPTRSPRPSPDPLIQTMGGTERLSRTLGSTYGLRSTRKATREANQNFRREPSLELRSSPPPQVDKGPRWTSDVIYPLVGKNKAVVHYSDLDRLAEEQMLNDNLVQFYIRWLQEKYPLQPKQVYFFPTHFYSSLTEGTRSIKYESVEKWTRKDDIFAYDFVMVPICETGHWYLALICNLPNLTRTTIDIDVEMTEEDKTSLTDAIEEIEESQVTEKMTPLKRPADGLLARADLYATQSFETQLSGMSIDSEAGSERLLTGTESSLHDAFDMAPESPVQTPQKNRSGSASKSKRRKLPKRRLDSTNPIVIILDSLGLSRQSAIKNLKEYIVAEAAAKKALQLTVNDIKGANVKRGIPQQPNYSDCGLYVCGYVEKFMDDPALFGKKLFEDEFDVELDWPNMNGSRMRTEMLKMLKDMAKDQEEVRAKVKAEKRVGKAKAVTDPSPNVRPDSMSERNLVNEEGDTMLKKDQISLSSKHEQQPSASEKVLQPKAIEETTTPRIEQTMFSSEQKDPEHVQSKVTNSLKSGEKHGMFEDLNEPFEMRKNSNLKNDNSVKSLDQQRNLPGPDDLVVKESQNETPTRSYVRETMEVDDDVERRSHVSDSQPSYDDDDASPVQFVQS